jgi:nucleoside-diphosphate-sugar epimerase
MGKAKPNVLVTGGAGFIGSHLVPNLLEEGYNITVFDNLTTGKIENLRTATKNPNFKFIQGDIRNVRQLQQAFRNIQVTIHLAAQIDVAASIVNSTETHEINTSGTFNVLQKAVENHVEKFVFASSTAVYGNATTLPVKEQNPLEPLSPYAASKAAGEAYCSAYANCHNLSTIILRFFNVYGKGNENSPYSGVITKFTQKALKNESLTIEGDGEQTRDFIHVSDAVKAICLALECRKVKTGIFNVCTGVPTSINELVDAIRKVTGKNLLAIHGPKRKGDVRESYGDPAKAAAELGFKSIVSLLDGLTQLLKAPE